MYESFRVRRLNARQSHEGLDRDARHEDDSDCDLPVLASFAHLHKVTLDLRYIIILLYYIIILLYDSSIILLW